MKDKGELARRWADYRELATTDTGLTIPYLLVCLLTTAVPMAEGTGLEQNPLEVTFNFLHASQIPEVPFVIALGHISLK